jgi:hypothetical protein
MKKNQSYFESAIKARGMPLGKLLSDECNDVKSVYEWHTPEYSQVMTATVCECSDLLQVEITLIFNIRDRRAEVYTNFIPMHTAIEYLAIVIYHHNWSAQL